MLRMTLLSVIVATVLLSGVTQAQMFDITSPGDAIIGVPDDNTWPGAEPPTAAIDDDTATKFLHFKTSWIPDQATGGAGFRVTPSQSKYVVMALNFCSANDSADRDPISFTLSGSNTSIDGPYQLIAEGTIDELNQGTALARLTYISAPVPIANRAAYKHYEVFFTEVRDRAAANSFQIAEVELLTDGSMGGAAGAPVPSDKETDVLRDSVLSWASGAYEGTHNLYFGESLDDVNNATVPTASGLTVNSYDPGRMEFGKTHYWRVDEVNASPDKTVHKGAVWSFEVEPFSVKLPFEAIAVTASSFQNATTDPNFMIDGSGIGEDGKHTNEVENVMWMSANGDASPGLMFEFDSAYKLEKLLIWNSNHASEAVIGWGIKDVEIETSADGVDWIAVPDVGSITQGPGFVPSDAQVIDTGLVQAKFVRINILNSWGGLLPQYGVAEVQFFAVPTQARTPMPADGAVDVRPDAVVAWRAGREADQSTIYVDMDANAVAEGTAASVSSNTNSVSLGSLDLQMSQTYYWRVDEVNNVEDPSVWAGPVWSLSTATSLVVDDFESYNNISPDRAFQHWLDGFGYSPDEFFPVEYLGNGTGAGIGHDIWSVASPHFEGDIMETSNTIAGSGQSMPFYYGNTGGVASQTEHTFAVPQDWTVGGANTLSIAFNGQTGNTGTMFIIINNIKITYTRDNGNISHSAWQAWNIDLATVNTTLSNITKLTLGVEGAGAAGMILFDDIRLFPGAGELLTPEDPGTNGLVAHYSFENNANDVSGNGNDGTLNGTPAFGTGVVGSALDCDGSDDYVTTGKTASQLGIGGNSPRTISSWVYTSDFVNGGIYDMGNRADSEDFSLRTMDSDNNWRIQYWGAGDSDFTFASLDTWVHFTHVHDGVSTKVYANGVIIADYEVTLDTTDDNPFQIGLYGFPDAYFFGLIDEVKVFNRALSAGEALYLAGITNPIDKPF